MRHAGGVGAGGGRAGRPGGRGARARAALIAAPPPPAAGVSARRRGPRGRPRAPSVAQRGRGGRRPTGRARAIGSWVHRPTLTLSSSRSSSASLGPSAPLSGASPSALTPARGSGARLRGRARASMAPPQGVARRARARGGSPTFRDPRADAGGGAIDGLLVQHESQQLPRLVHDGQVLQQLVAGAEVAPHGGDRRFEILHRQQRERRAGPGQHRAAFRIGGALTATASSRQPCGFRGRRGALRCGGARWSAGGGGCVRGGARGAVFALVHGLGPATHAATKAGPNPKAGNIPLCPRPHPAAAALSPRRTASCRTAGRGTR